MSFFEPTPISVHATIHFPLNEVKGAIRSLLATFPQYFIRKKNSTNEELGTYVFDRPKGVDTPTIRLTVSTVNEEDTNIEIQCSSNSFTATSDLQIAVAEVQNILMAKLNGKSDDEIKKVIKKNNSGNGVLGCFKSIGCLIVCGFMILCILLAILNVLL